VEQDFRVIDRQLGKGIDADLYARLQGHLQTATVLLVQELTAGAWRQGESDSLDFELDKCTRKTKPSAEESLTILQEEFVALRYLMFIRHVFRHLRNMLGFIIGGFVLAVIALSSYSFQGHRWIGVASTLALLALGAGVVMVFAGMDRDALLSRITATQPNEVGATFYMRVAQFGALPLVTVLASQFPALNHVLFSWVQPAIEALK